MYMYTYKNTKNIVKDTINILKNTELDDKFF